MINFDESTEFVLLGSMRKTRTAFVNDDQEPNNKNNINNNAEKNKKFCKHDTRQKNRLLFRESMFYRLEKTKKLMENIIIVITMKLKVKKPKTLSSREVFFSLCEIYLTRVSSTLS